MSLHCELRINRERIGWVNAVRATCGQGTEPDDINTYDAEVRDGDGIALWCGRVWHRYGDGAWGLLGSVIDAMQSQRPGVIADE